MKSKRWFFIASGTLFSAVGFLHLLRVLMQWQLVIGNWTAPYWLSILAFVVLWTLAFFAFKFSNKK